MWVYLLKSRPSNVFNHRLDNVQKILTHRFQTNHNMFQLQTSNGDMIKDMVVTPKEFDPRYGQSTQEEYYFNSLAHHEKVSEIVNSIGLSRLVIGIDFSLR